VLLWRWTLLKSYNLCMVATTFNSNEAFIISRLANATRRRNGASVPQPPQPQPPPPPRPLLCCVLLQGVYIATLPNEVAK
jgi:hypothetical protein